jgi:hypothetical protein
MSVTPIFVYNSCYIHHPRVALIEQNEINLKEGLLDIKYNSNVQYFMCKLLRIHRFKANNHHCQLRLIRNIIDIFIQTVFLNDSDPSK